MGKGNTYRLIDSFYCVVGIIGALIMDCICLFISHDDNNFFYSNIVSYHLRPVDYKSHEFSNKMVQT
jgi:hypothetical protein